MGKIERLNTETLFPFLKDNSLFVSKRIPKGTVIFDEGDQCGGIAFVLNGSIRVSKVGKNGREVVLYRVCRGDSCILTIASVLSNISYPATAIVEEDVEVILIPVQQFKMQMAINFELQQFTYTNKHLFNKKVIM